MRRTSRNWFRRRPLGLGWRPVSWQAWTITLLAVAAVIGVLLILRGSAARIPIVILILAANELDLDVIKCTKILHALL